MQIPDSKVHAHVEHGWVIPEGEVDYDYQRREVERMVRHPRGVVGITNTIVIVPRAAFQRQASVDARYVTVDASNHTVKLYGHVRSLRESNAAASAAAAARASRRSRTTSSSHPDIGLWERRWA